MEHIEQGNMETPGELVFNTLEVRDSVILETISGSVYTLLVQQVSEDMTLVTINRTSDHGVKEVNADDRFPDTPTLFDLRGSCRSAYIMGTDLVPKDPTPGRFIVGERAWLGTQIDGQDKTLLTSKLLAIQTIKRA